MDSPGAQRVRQSEQGGLGQDAIQTVASQQPRIVAAGSDQTSGLSAVLVLGNGAARPCMTVAHSSVQCLGNSGFALGGAAFAACSVASRAASFTAGYPRLLSYAAPGYADYNSGASAIFYYWNGGTLRTYHSGDASSAPLAGLAPFQAACVFDGATGTLTLDGVAAGTGAASGALAAAGTLGIGVGDTNQSWDGAVSEVVVIAGSLSAADQATVRASQQAYYGTP